MVIEIDFNSDEAIYMQITNQIIMGIATSRLHEGDALPSVRQLASIAGINMHTVNKAYALLRQEGFVTIDRRKGAVISGKENEWTEFVADPVKVEAVKAYVAVKVRLLGFDPPQSAPPWKR